MGAAHVHSVEPSTDNFTRLERTRAAHTGRSSWTSEKAAVGDSHGEVDLYLSADSWAHSLHADMVDAVTVESVRMVPLTDVLGRLVAEHAGIPVILKINVEGSVGSILLPADDSALSAVAEVCFDHEPGSPYPVSHVLDHLAAVGLDDVESAHGKIFRVRRSTRRRVE
jgi:FkbM family methyltransferase